MNMWYDDQSVIILFLHIRSLTDDLSTHVLLLLPFAPGCTTTADDDDTGTVVDRKKVPHNYVLCPVWGSI